MHLPSVTLWVTLCLHLYTSRQLQPFLPGSPGVPECPANPGGPGSPRRPWWPFWPVMPGAPLKEKRRQGEFIDIETDIQKDTAVWPHSISSTIGNGIQVSGNVMLKC